MESNHFIHHLVFNQCPFRWVRLDVLAQEMLDIQAFATHTHLSFTPQVSIDSVEYHDEVIPLRLIATPRLRNMGLSMLAAVMTRHHARMPTMEQVYQEHKRIVSDIQKALRYHNNMSSETQPTWMRVIADRVRNAEDKCAIDKLLFNNDDYSDSLPTRQENDEVYFKETLCEEMLLIEVLQYRYGVPIRIVEAGTLYK